MSRLEIICDGYEPYDTVVINGVEYEEKLERIPPRKYRVRYRLQLEKRIHESVIDIDTFVDHIGSSAEIVGIEREERHGIQKHKS